MIGQILISSVDLIRVQVVNSDHLVKCKHYFVSTIQRSSSWIQAIPDIILSAIQKRRSCYMDEKIYKTHCVTNVPNCSNNIL